MEALCWHTVQVKQSLQHSIERAEIARNLEELQAAQAAQVTKAGDTKELDLISAHTAVLQTCNAELKEQEARATGSQVIGLN